MKKNLKDIAHKDSDDLYGLLSMYKSNNTYIKIMVSNEAGSILVMLTDNPGNWKKLEKEKTASYREMKRLELGSPRLFIKYTHPEHLVKVLGEALNIHVPRNKVSVTGSPAEGSCYIINFPLKYRAKIITGVNRLIALNPHKKYEIIEKFFAKLQE